MLESLIKEVKDWVDRQEERMIIAVSGHGAAGKTTFSNKLIGHLGERQVNYLNTDPYIISSEIRKQTFINYTYQNKNHHYKMTACHPAAHHLPSLARDVRMIKDGINLYTIPTHYQKSALLSSGKKVTIAGGMSVAFLNPALFDLKLYFYTDGETEILRRTGRDVLERGSDIDYLRQSHNERRIQYEVFMHPYSRHFDVIIKTSDGTVWTEKNGLVAQPVKSALRVNSENR